MNVEMNLVLGLEASIFVAIDSSQPLCRFDIITVKISTRFFVEIDKLILKSIWKCKEI